MQTDLPVVTQRFTGTSQAFRRTRPMNWHQCQGRSCFVNSRDEQLVVWLLTLWAKAHGVGAGTTAMFLWVVSDASQLATPTSHQGIDMVKVVEH